MSEAFISYSRADSAFADKLRNDLEHRGISVWIDRDDIEGGAAWRASISKAIRSCCAFILILSPRSTQSSQVSKELSVAESHNRLIVLVVIEACDIPPGMELQLAELQWISFAELPYNAALDRLTRVITEARSRTADASLSSGRITADSASPATARPATPTASAPKTPQPGAGSGSSRKWLFAGSAAVVVAGAAVVAFNFARDGEANTTRKDTARVETKAAPAEATPAVAGAVPVVTAAAVQDRTEAPARKRASTSASTPSGPERGATRSEVQERTVAAPEKPTVVARADPAPLKPANAPRADAAPAQASGPIVGNTRTLLYHFPGCPNYSKIGPQVRIEFSSARDAERAGYRLSDNCADPSGGRAAAAVIANSRTHDYFLPHCNGYAGIRPEYRVPFNSTAEAERAGYRRSARCQ